MNRNIEAPAIKIAGWLMQTSVMTNCLNWNGTLPGPTIMSSIRNEKRPSVWICAMLIVPRVLGVEQVGFAAPATSEPPFSVMETSGIYKESTMEEQRPAPPLQEPCSYPCSEPSSISPLWTGWEMSRMPRVLVRKKSHSASLPRPQPHR
jgi:hypothetical protein